MNTAEFQSRIIDKLDKVVAGSEALMMNEQSRTVADFARLKAEIRDLLEIVADFERLCHGGESSLQSVKETLAALKRTVGTEASAAGPADLPAAPDRAETEGEDPMEEGLSFGFEVLSAESVMPEASMEAEVAGSAGGSGRPAMPEAAGNARPVEPELDLMFESDGESESAVAEPVSEPRAVLESETETRSDPGSASGLEREEGCPSVETASTAEPVASPAPEAVSEPTLPAAEPQVAVPEVKVAPETEAAPAISPGPDPSYDTEAAAPAPVEPSATANEIFEAIKQENLARFSVREEDQPQSYITQLTAMAQAQVKPGEQDMSGVAVSSTARPDDRPEPASASSGDSLMDSLRSTRANLYGGQLRTIVDKFKAPQTLYDIQHHQVDLKMVIGVNEKYLLTQELFGGNVKEYTEAVSRLNDAKDAAAAMAVWQGLSRQRGWDGQALAYATFYDLLKRRFPDLDEVG